MARGPHYSLIKHRMPDWLYTTAWPRAQALGQVSMARLPALLRTAATDHAPLIPTQAADTLSLKKQVIDSQQAALNNAAHLALLHAPPPTARSRISPAPRRFVTP